ncbi:MAG: CBS domain-containing protein [Deltaproteobacteria bacterium]|jgi:CBS domain-containing protein|nr:CBS domain-containing protein [Deltaproteobacteria bacterium]MBW1875168.1 CBS domain-containing protein [Deltaproteobacteria bacterium]MBW2210408.1 CBS domain-containing protein [Deltaproteobacteria bacterium]MBW2213929.1 CBS domain-containing protein [Deltaproteobacteria bacterium]MBW2378799.1 CBS domain-containing protein [Deltaproteobacteria bacterium]
MTTAAQLLNDKGHNVETIAPDATVYDAIKRMADLDIGALVVVDNGQVAGLITERDYARNVFLKGKASPTTPVREAMADEVLSIGRGETTRDCMAIMTGKRTRHLLVMEGRELLGILSIGDLVRSIVAEQDMTIEQLEQYIHRG